MKDILSLGAGVQSSTLALMSRWGILAEHGYKIDCAIFADTQAEPASVYRWLVREPSSRLPTHGGGRAYPGKKSKAYGVPPGHAPSDRLFRTIQPLTKHK